MEASKGFGSVCGMKAKLELALRVGVGLALPEVEAGVARMAVGVGWSGGTGVLARVA